MATLDDIRHDDDSILEDIDPDGNYFTSLEQNGLCQSKYYNEEMFNDNFQHCSENSVSMFHLNIRSLVSNFRNLDLMLSSLRMEFDVIGLTETWLTRNNNNIYNFTNYNHIYKIRDGKRGGCVSMYIKKVIDNFF